MLKSLKNFLLGFGSVLNIWPSSNHEDIELPKYDPVERYQQYSRNIQVYWNNVGGYIGKAINQTDKE